MLAKISSILPSTPRITNVDVATERPMRRGMPTFGLPVAKESNPRAEFRQMQPELKFDSQTYDKSGQVEFQEKFISAIDDEVATDSLAKLDVKV